MIYVEEKYRVNVYLDTNILLDYIENVSQSLNDSIEYLANNPFVCLRSSHYVLFELVENRKARLFFERTKNEGDTYNKGLLKRSWNNNGHDYTEYKAEITQQVLKDVSHLKDDLNIDFNEHVLHEGLLLPTNEVCLNTKVSKEDSLVTVSCMNPKLNVPIDYCLILTHDRQFCKSFTDAKNDIYDVFARRNIKMPKLINVVQFPINGDGGYVDLYSVSSKDILIQYWNDLILASLKEMLNDIYIGGTYKFGSNGIPARCIYIDGSEARGKQLRSSDGLICISKDLKHWIIINNSKEVPIEYWNMGTKISLPILIEEKPKYSFYKKDIKDEELVWMREKGNLVFYYDL